MWSLGCVIAELFLGWPLYPGSSEYDQVCRNELSFEETFTMVYRLLLYLQLLLSIISLSISNVKQLPNKHTVDIVSFTENDMNECKNLTLILVCAKTSKE